MYGLLEAALDLEAQAIEANDLDGAERRIGAHQDARPPSGVDDGHKAYEPTRRAPQQITDAATQSDVALAVNRTGNLLHGFDIREQRLELYLLAVGLGSPLFPPAFLLRSGSVCYRIGFDPGHQMVALLEQAVHHLAGGVVGIGDKVERNLDRQDIEQAEHLVEQGALIAVGPYQTFMDAHGERHREDALGRVYEQADSLHGMPHDVLGLGVRFRLLMQKLYGWHFLADSNILPTVLGSIPNRRATARLLSPSIRTACRTFA